MKSKGYAKGGAKMMKAMRGKMAKGYAKGGAKKVMKAMGGRMMAKGYAKGGAKKVMKASRGTASFMKNSGKQAQKASNQKSFTRAAFMRVLRSSGEDRITAADVKAAMSRMGKRINKDK